MSTGGDLGSGGFFGAVPEGLRPNGPHGLWPSCGCSSLFIILGVIFLVCGGCMNLFNQ